MIQAATSLSQEMDTLSGFLVVAPDVLGVTTGFVNVFFVGEPGQRDWVLVDAGMSLFAPRIISAAERLYGEGARPRAIVLTHGHFDHIGGLKALLAKWDVPVYAHRSELPYITGKSAYPPPDPAVGGGMMAISSFLLPRGPFDFGDAVQALPEDGSIPVMPGWKWSATPGHTPGHVALFRESDRTLLAGDAFVMQKQESLYHALAADREMHGPPMYFTPDWPAARLSVRRLADLNLESAGTGHGPPAFGPALRSELTRLAENFDQLAMPRQGRYLKESAITHAEKGVISYPSAHPLEYVYKAAFAGLAVGAAALAVRALRGRSDS